MNRLHPGGLKNLGIGDIRGRSGFPDLKLQLPAVIADPGMAPQGQGSDFRVTGFDGDGNGGPIAFFAVLNDGLNRRQTGEGIVHGHQAAAAVAGAKTRTVQVKAHRLIGQDLKVPVLKLNPAAFVKSPLDQADGLPAVRPVRFNR